jgi:hypothetical protein
MTMGPLPPPVLHPWLADQVRAMGCCYPVDNIRYPRTCQYDPHLVAAWADKAAATDQVVGAGDKAETLWQRFRN